MFLIKNTCRSTVNQVFRGKSELSAKIQAIRLLTKSQKNNYKIHTCTNKLNVYRSNTYQQSISKLNPLIMYYSSFVLYIRLFLPYFRWLGPKDRLFWMVFTRIRQNNF